MIIAIIATVIVAVYFCVYALAKAAKASDEQMREAFRVWDDDEYKRTGDK